jgi:hypothetical protein
MINALAVALLLALAYPLLQSLGLSPQMTRRMYALLILTTAIQILLRVDLLTLFAS